MVFNYRMGLLIVIDAILVNSSMIIALLIRFDGRVPLPYSENYFYNAPYVTVIVMILFFLFGLYRRAWKYASINELLAILGAVALGNLAALIFMFYINGQSLPLPKSVIIIYVVLQSVFIGGSRLFWRLYRDYGQVMMNKKSRKRVLIVGAGDGGVLVAKEMKSHYKGEISIIGFIDDDESKQKMIIQGVPVLGKRNDIPRLVEKHQVEEIIIAIPSAGGSEKKKIFDICRQTKAKVKTLPGVYDLIDGRFRISSIRNVEVEDLLGREPVHADLNQIADYISNQVVLITGGGGSIGSELCRQVAEYRPKTLLILDACENNVYEIDMEMRRSYPKLHMVPLVKDIRDRKSVINVFKTYRPQVVFHAAAFKHVPMMEYNPEDAIKNNVMGTYHVAQVADIFGASKFVLISTDKAVNPTSVMGATKRMAEMVIQYMETVSRTSFVAVRFGNVLGSKGSVVPLFKRQIAEGGPLTVTHPEMVRYFMTIPEAVQLVIQAGAMAKGGEIFVLDMGEPVRIVDLAKSLIELSGLEPGKDIEIKFTGIRPGEKLYEELLTAEEGVTATAHNRIFVAQIGSVNAKLIEDRIINRIVHGTLPQNKTAALRMIKELVPNFRAESSIEKTEQVVS
ncbi:MAG TPA: polysaccharide biosynthesis protein [Clostridia bacterium]|jgi:FlaA1/EpsC-like NDP-sugar epimerase|nr:polysaccharide biosynthesis protein [Clostridia bacterium]